MQVGRVLRYNRLRVVRTRSVSALLFGGLLWGLVQPSAVRANEFDEFQKARAAYEANEYEASAMLFHELVGGEVPRLQNRPLFVESLKFLAASYMFLGREAEAEGTFERLLTREPDYVLDPLAFPSDVQTVFQRVKERLQLRRAEEAAARSRAEERARRLDLDRRMRERERQQRLVELAQTERVEEVRSRWVAMVPFGVGQFQNGHDGLGLVLAVTEGLLVATSITTWALHENLRGQNPADAELEDAQFAERALRITNQVSIAMFATMAITGILDAQLRFKKSNSYDRQRELPEDLKGSFELGLSPSRMDLTIRF